MKRNLSLLTRSLSTLAICLSLGCGNQTPSSNLSATQDDIGLEAAKRYVQSLPRSKTTDLLGLITANNEANLATKISQMKSQAQTNPEYLRYHTTPDGKNAAIAAAAGVSVYTLGILPAAAVSGATQASAVAAGWFVGTPIVVVGGVVFIGLEGWEWFSISGNRRALDRAIALEMSTRKEICDLTETLSTAERKLVAGQFKTYSAYLGYQDWASTYPSQLPAKMVVGQLARGEKPYWCQ